MRDHGADDTAEELAAIILHGQPASPGVSFGRVKVVRSPDEMDIVEPGDILVAEMTTPDYVPAMKRAVAIITDRGGRTDDGVVKRQVRVRAERGVP